MPVHHYGSRRVSGEIPQQGPIIYPNTLFDLGFALISGTTNDYELVRQRSASLTLSEHTNDVGKIDTLVSVVTAFIISENAAGATIIG